MESLDGLKLAPFHLMATEGKAHVDRDHVWHMDTLAEVCHHEPRLLLATPYMVVDVTDPASQEQGAIWWLELTGRGGEGMVIKPLTFVTKGKRGLAQPAVNCRGREYLRIIYGPECTAKEHLDRTSMPSSQTQRSRDHVIRSYCSAVTRCLTGSPRAYRSTFSTAISPRKRR